MSAFEDKLAGTYIGNRCKFKKYVCRDRKDLLYKHVKCVLPIGENCPKPRHCSHYIPEED